MTQAAVLLNVTSVGQTTNGWATVYPMGQAVPATSTLNFGTSEYAIANSTTMRVGTAGQVCVSVGTVGAVPGSSHVILDATGYLSSSALSQFPMLTSPQRLIDTRTSGGPIATGTSRCFQVAGVAGVPADAAAVVLNVTSVGYGTRGWLTAYPAGQAVPPTSTLNFDTSEYAVANGTITRLGTGGQVCVNVGTLNSTPGDSHVVLDATGYLTAALGQLPMLTSPQRLADTRVSGGPIATGNSRCFTVAGVAGIPATATGLVLNMTAVGYDAEGWPTAYPAGGGLPATSTLNFNTSEYAMANGTIIGVGTSGQVCVAVGTVNSAPANSQVILDVVGYLSPSPTAKPIATATASPTSMAPLTITPTASATSTVTPTSSATPTSTVTLPPGSGSGIVGSIGGSVTTPGGAASVSLPAGAVPDGTTIQIVPLSTGAPPLPSSFAAASLVYDFRDFGPTGAPLTDFGEPVQLTFSYTGTAPSAVAFFDGSIWVAVPTTVDTSTNTITGMTIHFTTFVVFGPSGSPLPPPPPPTPTPTPKPVAVRVNPFGTEALANGPFQVQVVNAQLTPVAAPTDITVTLMRNVFSACPPDGNPRFSSSRTVTISAPQMAGGSLDAAGADPGCNTSPITTQWVVCQAVQAPNANLDLTGVPSNELSVAIARGSVSGAPAPFPVPCPPPTVLPKLDLKSATTTDSQSVTIDYTVSQADFTQPITLEVFRAAAPCSAQIPTTTAIGATTLDVTQLDQRPHTVVLNGINLPPSTGMPCVVVVANRGTPVPEDSASTNATYFKKWLIGVVTHGLTLPLGGSQIQMLWVRQTAASLLADDKFDAVIGYDWTADSALFPSLTIQQHADDLYDHWIKMYATILLSGQHPGDVVDVHLIGHSRGAVLISLALNRFGPSYHRSNKAPVGSYVEVTFLDPHPANKGQNTYASGGGCSGTSSVPPPDPASGMSVGIGMFLTPFPVLSAVLGFDLARGDVEPVLPTGVVQGTDLWFQRTPAMVNNWAKWFPNLWGEDQISTGGATLKQPVNDLTCQRMPSTGALSPGIFILHSEIRDFYLKTAVAQGGVDP